MHPGQSIEAECRYSIHGNIGYLIDSNACAMSVEQMARVGSPLPSEIIRRLHRVGTGGVGRR